MKCFDEARGGDFMCQQYSARIGLVVVFLSMW